MEPILESDPRAICAPAPSSLDRAGREAQASPLLSGCDLPRVAMRPTSIQPSQGDDDPTRLTDAALYPPRDLNRTARADWLRLKLAISLQTSGWLASYAGQWERPAQRWSLECAIICSDPHTPLIVRTGFPHPIMFDHSKLQRGVTWQKRAHGYLRTYLLVLCYDRSSEFSVRNGVYRVELPSLVRRYAQDGRIHCCARACLPGSRGMIWHAPFDVLRPVRSWQELAWR